MQELPSITNFFLQGTGILILKIPLLVLLGIFSLFLFIVSNRIKALNRTLTITAGQASKKIQTFAIIQLILAISLFLITLVIV